MTTPAPELSPGTVISNYTLGAKLRVRSGAATYVATSPEGTAVHITIYAGACFPSTLIRERTLRELRQLVSVSAPQLAKVIAAGKHGDDGVFEVNEIVEGTGMDSVGKLSAAEMAGAIGAVGEALLAAQRVGVIHRNLGLGSVFSTPAGIKVLGFAVGEPQGDGAFGSIDTLAPEQVSGKVVDQRSLIYNLAAMGHQLLTGAPIYDGTTAEKLQAHQAAELPADVHEKLRRALNKEPRTRPMMLKQFLIDVVSIGGLAASSSNAAGAGTRDIPPAAKPSTRGWTMFMDAAEAEGPAPSPATPSPEASAPAGEPPSTNAELPAAGAKPSTRGWTMFMDAADAEGPTTASEPSTPIVSAPISEKNVQDAKPSTRGWTMFMDGDEASSSGAAAPAASSPAAPPPAAAATGPAGQAPSTRGWTMFADTASTPAAPSVAEPKVAPAPPPPSDNPSVGQAGAVPSTRGWTMFMDAPLPESGDEKSPTPEIPAATAAAAPAATATSAVDGASDTKGWTVFVDQPAVESAEGGKTMLATGGIAGGVASSGGQPDTMYFKQGASDPERVAATRNQPAEADVRAPSSSAPAVEPPSISAGIGAPPTSSMVSPGQSAPVPSEDPGAGNTATIVVIGLIVVGGFVAALLLL